MSCIICQPWHRKVYVDGCPNSQDPCFKPLTKVEDRKSLNNN